MLLHGLAWLVAGRAPVQGAAFRLGNGAIDVEPYGLRGAVAASGAAERSPRPAHPAPRAYPPTAPGEDAARPGTSSPAAGDTSAPPGASPGGGATGGAPGVTDGSDIGIAPPAYPELSRLRGEEGPVLLELGLDAATRLGALSVVGSSGYPMLDRAAARAVRESLAPAPDGAALTKKRVRFVFRLR